MHALKYKIYSYNRCKNATATDPMKQLKYNPAPQNSRWLMDSKVRIHYVK